MIQDFSATAECAAALDARDALAAYKQQFLFPQHNGENSIYFCGNSLGLQPKSVRAAIDVELNSWQNLGVNGYMKGDNPWLFYADYCKPALVKLVGAAGVHEVTVMNALTVNLHLMLLSFYRPTASRYKIMLEAGAFPSDQYAVETQVLMHQLQEQDAIIEIAPRNGEKLLRTEDIIAAINEHGHSLALTIFSGMNYYTGQLFDMAAITKAAHEAGALAGFDLAHVAGNVPVKLHDWNVDFAVWCSYKYLNSGPGAVGGAFVHEKHTNTQTPRLGGWWGNDEKTRFKMEKGFIPKPDASGWNMSTSQVFNTVCLKASLEIFEQAGIHHLRQKSILLTQWLEFLLQKITNIGFEIITPTNPEERGAQLSLYFKEKGRDIFNAMSDNGIIVDYREPGVIRVAPAPLYCSFSDVFKFYSILKEI